MDNILLTPATYAKGVLMNLGGYLSVASNMSHDYEALFGKEGAMIGDTVSIKKPTRFRTTSGLNYQGQPIKQPKVTLTVDKTTGVHFDWDGIERTLSVQDAQKNFFKPAAIAIASDINAQAARFAARNTFNVVGTPGTTPTLIDTYLDAGDKIVQLGLPAEEDLHCIVDRKMSSAYVKGQKALYNPAGTIGGLIKKGEVTDDTLGYTWHRDQTIYRHTVGPLGGTPLVSGANQTSEGGMNGTISLLTKGWTSAAAGRLKFGDKFTIANVYSVHPQTKQSTGDLLQFTVLADFSSDGSGNGSASVAPGITLTGSEQNVDSLPADSAAITVVGAASTATPMGLLMHENAFALVSVPLKAPTTGVISSTRATDPDTGLNLSLVRYFDGDNFVEKTRFDVLWGIGVLYRELCTVICG